MLNQYLIDWVSKAKQERFVATRDANNVPCTHYAMTSWANKEGTEITLLVAARTAFELVANLEDNGQIAFTAGEMEGAHEMYQFKGQLVSLEAPHDEHYDALDAFFEYSDSLLGEMGASQETRDWFAATPRTVFTVTMRVEQVFGQTPGPKAGNKYEGAST